MAQHINRLGQCYRLITKEPPHYYVIQNLAPIITVAKTNHHYTRWDTSNCMMAQCALQPFMELPSKSNVCS